MISQERVDYIVKMSATIADQMVELNALREQLEKAQAAGASRSTTPSKSGRSEAA